METMERFRVVSALPFEEYATAAQGALADTAVQNVQGVSGIWQGTQEEYDALTPDTNTLYFIV